MDERELLTFDDLLECLDLLEHRKFLARQAQRRVATLLRDFLGVANTQLGTRSLIQERPEKRHSRAMEKIVQYRSDSPGRSLKECVERIDDLAGGRFLLLYLADVRRAHEHFCRFLERRRVIKLDGTEKDYITSAKQSGYRALHQGVRLRLGSATWFPAEIQFMTFMQLDWAEKEHLVYENSQLFSDEIRHELRSLSDEMHELGGRSDELRDAIIRTLEGATPNT